MSKNHPEIYTKLPNSGQCNKHRDLASLETWPRYWQKGRVKRRENSLHVYPRLNGVSPFRSLFFCSPNSQSRPQIFSVNGSIICSGIHFWRHFDVIGSIIYSGLHFDVSDSIWRRFFPNLVNSSWSWWIMRVVLTKQKRGNILNE